MTINIKAILKKFGIDAPTDLKSLYPYAPVYQFTMHEQKLVLKQTKSDRDEALALAKFTKHLQLAHVPIVAPIALPKNPMTVQDENWIIDPFIEGDSYSGRQEEIIAAGRLLGKIHALSSNDNREQLEIYNELNLDQEEIDEGLITLKSHLSTAKARCGINVNFEGLQTTIHSFIARQGDLKALPLPKVASPYDFKADNLIYLDAQHPYLIDPDNALFIPRIFDLALALLLFHNVLKSAPNRVFTTDEWHYFKQGYFAYIQLTPLEKSVWIDAIQHLFLDEVLWLMGDFSEGWQDQRQTDLFISILQLMLHPEKLNHYHLN